MTSNQPTVLVFDSGVGGLSILREVRAELPGCRYIYACDNRAFPYGTKSEEELIDRVDLVLKALIAETNPDIVVIACNTASTVALPKIRAHFLKPVVGVVPAIKPAAALSHSKVIGLLATPGTTNRPYTQWLIDEFANNCNVIRVGSSRLVEIAEAKLRGNAADPAELAMIIAPLFENQAMDTVVLACTHFPLLEEQLRAVAPRAVNWIDSGEAIARRVASFTGASSSADIEKTTTSSTTQPKFACWLTRLEGDVESLKAGLIRFGAGEIRNLDL